MDSEENSCNKLESKTHFNDPNILSGDTVDDEKSEVAKVTFVDESSEKLSVVASEDDDSDVKSDAGTTFHRQPKDDSIDELLDGDDEEEEDVVDTILYDEGVKKKLEILAQMVGADSSKPWIVLDEVVKTLKELERKKNLLFSSFKK